MKKMLNFLLVLAVFLGVNLMAKDEFLKEQTMAGQNLKEIYLAGAAFGACRDILKRYLAW